MNQLKSLKELEQAFSIESLSKVSNYDSYFRMIAESLINNFQINNGDEIFRFVELEFYLRATEEDNRKIAYERITNAGDWFLHDNGVDIAFESNKNFYGGILVRSIKTAKSFNEEGEFINGPRKCSWYILDGINAFQDTPRLPRIQKAQIIESCNIESFTRHGIKNDNKRFRFTIPLNIWEHKGYSGFPKK